MELINEIKRIIKELGFVTPLVSAYYDEQKHILIRVTSSSFDELDDTDVQDILWNQLQANLPLDDFKRIISVIHETPNEINTKRTFEPQDSKLFYNIWFHKTTEEKTYWLFIDIAKFVDNYQTFFLIINAKDNFEKGLVFNYSNEVIEFMELGQKEIANELFNSTFNSAEAEIKIHLMIKSDELDNKGLRGRDNYLSYVYDSFEIKKATKSDLFFTNDEIKMIEKAIKKVGEYKLKSEILQAIEISKRINASIDKI